MSLWVRGKVQKRVKPYVPVGIKGALHLVVRYKYEFLIAISFITGWMLITAALASLLFPEMWLFGIGLLLIGLTGYQYSYTILFQGLYYIVKSPDSAEQREE